MRSGWQTIPMGQLCSIKNGKSDTVDAVDDGSYAFFDRSRTVKRSSRFLFDCEALIIPGEGKEFLPRHFVGKFDLHQRAYALHSFSEQIDVRFLYHYLHHRADYLPSVAVGATVKSLRMRHFEQFPIQVTDVTNQKRIVSILDEAFEGIATATANAEKNLRNARELFDSYLMTAFTTKAEGWIERRLSDVCPEITVGHVGSMANEYKASGIPFLRSQNIRPFEVSFENLVYIDETFHKALKKSTLRAGDLAIVRTGYPGTAAVIPPELGEVNCSDLVIVKLGNEVNPHYLAAFFNSSFGKQLVGGKLVGAAQKHFNVTAAKQVAIALPPVLEQGAIVKHIHEFRYQVNQLEAIYQQKLSALAELKKSILHQAFSGQLH